MSLYGKSIHGKQERRKELGRIAMMHPNTFVAQTVAAIPNHFYKSVLEAASFDGPAVLVTFTTCQPEHGVGDDQSRHQSKLAVESRAFPVFIYDPRKGDTIRQRLSLQGNPAKDHDWYTVPKTNEVIDFIAFARTEGRFAKNFDKDGNPSDVMLAAQAIRAGDAELIVAGGMESMTNAPYLMPQARAGARLGHAKLLDSMVHDGLWDIYNDFHMGITGELVAEKHEVSRTAQDEFAAESHRKATEATEAGRFDDEKRDKPVRMHGRHVLNRYEDGMEKCIGCELCAGVCPARCIYVRGADNAPDNPVSPGERYGYVYEINYLRCIHCDLCVEACPTEAITESKLFEFSFTNRQDAIYTKKELLVDDDGKPKQLPWEDWRDGEDELTSGWMRATSPSGDATFRGVVGWSNELGHGERAPEPPQPESDR